MSRPGVSLSPLSPAFDEDTSSPHHNFVFGDWSECLLVTTTEHLVEPHIQTMRGKMAGQVHNLEQKAMDLYTARNFAGLAQFLAELKSAPAQAAQST